MILAQGAASVPRFAADQPLLRDGDVDAGDGRMAG